MLKGRVKEIKIKKNQPAELRRMYNAVIYNALSMGHPCHADKHLLVLKFVQQKQYFNK